MTNVDKPTTIFNDTNVSADRARSAFSMEKIEALRDIGIEKNRVSAVLRNNGFGPEANNLDAIALNSGPLADYLTELLIGVPDEDGIHRPEIFRRLSLYGAMASIDPSNHTATPFSTLLLANGAISALRKIELASNSADLPLPVNIPIEVTDHLCEPCGETPDPIIWTQPEGLSSNDQIDQLVDFLSNFDDSYQNAIIEENAFFQNATEILERYSQASQLAEATDQFPLLLSIIGMMRDDLIEAIT